MVIDVFFCVLLFVCQIYICLNSRRLSLKARVIHHMVLLVQTRALFYISIYFPFPNLHLTLQSISCNIFAIGKDSIVVSSNWIGTTALLGNFLFAPTIERSEVFYLPCNICILSYLHFYLLTNDSSLVCQVNNQHESQMTVGRASARLTLLWAK